MATVFLKTKFQYFYLLFVAAIISCGTTNNISSGKLSHSIKYKINNYAGCCGCSASYFNIYQNGITQEQVIYRYNCYSSGMPTKFIFKYDNDGNLLYCEKFVATINNDFETPVSANEKYLFEQLDKTQTLVIHDSTIRYSEFKGFRKPKGNETTHMFPLISGGAKVKVQ